MVLKAIFAKSFLGALPLTPPGLWLWTPVGASFPDPHFQGLHPRLKLGASPDLLQDISQQNFMGEVFIAYKYRWTIEYSKNMKLKYFKNWLIVILNC